MDELEQKELNLLNRKTFIIPVKILWFTIAMRTKPLTLGRLLKLSNVFIKMELDEKGLYSDNFEEIIANRYQAISKNTKKAVKVLAIMLSDNRVIQWLLRRCLLRMMPNELLAVVKEIISASDYANFISSIALMNGNRPTRAMQIEEMVSNPSTEL